MFAFTCSESDKVLFPGKIYRQQISYKDSSLISRSSSHLSRGELITLRVSKGKDQVMGLYILTFCRIVIGLVFAWAFVGKVQDISAFIKTITQFEILPEWQIRPIGYMFLAGEVIVAFSMLAGGSLLRVGFTLAALLLVAFCIALSSVLLRKIKTPCNCFGSSKKLVSSYDLVRNIGFIACALGGFGASIIERNNLVSSGLLNYFLIGVVALVFVALWIQIEEIAHLLRGS